MKSLDEINISIIEKAPLIEDFFYDEEWGGVNAVYPFSPNEKEKYLVLGHIAKFTEDGCRHYYPIVFDFDTEKRLAWNVQIIAERSDLPAGEAKRSDLYDIIYSGGLYFEDGKVFLYAGVGDCEAWRIEVFLKIKEDL